MKTESGRIFFVYATSLLYKSGAVLVARKPPAFLHHLRGKQNYQALFVHRSDIKENYL